MTEYRFGNAIVKITRPVLTPDEAAKSEQRIRVALQQFGREMQDAERKKKTT